MFHKKPSCHSKIIRIRKMMDKATLWTEEKLTKLIAKIITRALDEQQ